MKSILLSIRPEWVAKILRGEKTIEIRRQFPKDYEGWVYIYCSKGTPKTQLIDNRNINNKFELCWCLKNDREQLKKHIINGKVVARFWCDKVEEIEFSTLYDDEFEFDYYTKTLDFGRLVELSKVSYEQMHDYLKGKNGYAIHISKLEVFDEPKEIWKFKRNIELFKEPFNSVYGKKVVGTCEVVLRAPQNYCYVEVENE